MTISDFCDPKTISGTTNSCNKLVAKLPSGFAKYVFWILVVLIPLKFNFLKFVHPFKKLLGKLITASSLIFPICNSVNIVGDNGTSAMVILPL